MNVDSMMDRTHSSVHAREFLERRELEESQDWSDSYIPAGQLRGSHFLASPHVARAHSSAAITPQDPHLEGYAAKQRDRPQTAHAGLGEDCSHLWRQVGEYAEQRRAGGHSVSDLLTKPSHQSQVQASEPASRFENVNPSARQPRRPVSVYIARSAREGVESHRPHSTTTGEREEDMRASLSARGTAAAASVFRSSREKVVPELTPPRGTARPRPFDDNWGTAASPSHRPRSAGVVHTNPSYRLPPRPSTAARRLTSRRQLSWNQFEEHIAEEPFSVSETPRSAASAAVEISHSHPAPSPRSRHGSTADSRGHDVLLRHPPLLTLPLFAIPGSTVASPLLAKDDVRPQASPIVVQPPAPADDDQLLPVDTENPAAAEKISWLGRRPDADSLELSTSRPSELRQRSDPRQLQDPEDGYADIFKDRPGSPLASVQSEGSPSGSRVHEDHAHSTAGSLGRMSGAELRPASAFRAGSGARAQQLGVRTEPQPSDCKSRKRPGRRRASKSPLLQKVDLHVRRKKVFRVRNLGEDRSKDSGASVANASEPGSLVPVPDAGPRSSIKLPRDKKEAGRQTVMMEEAAGWSSEDEYYGIPVFERQESETITMNLTVLQACDLENTKMWGMNDPYCTIEVEQRVKRTRIIPSTVDPEWNETFVFAMRNLRSNITIKVMDKHADPDFNVIGVVDFRVIDVMSRSGWPRDSDTFSGTTWFVLQDPSGLPTTSTVQLQFDMEGCQHWQLEPEQKAPRMEEVASSLMSMLPDLQDESLTTPTKSRKQMYQKRAHSSADQLDLNSMFQGQKPLDEGCAEGYYSARSCGRFSQHSRVRRLVFALVTSSSFHFISWSAAFAACVAVGAQPQPVDPAGSAWGRIELVSNIFLSLEILLKSIAFGFADKASSFLFGSAFNGIDLIVAVSYWAELSLPPPYNNELTLRPFRLFRLMIPLTYFKIFLGLTSIFLTLKRAALSLLTVISLTILFFLGFGIFAVTFYHDSFSRRCVSASTGEIMIPERWCKSEDGDGGSSCFEGQLCVIVGNPDGVNFDHMGRALVSIFLAVGLDGLQDIMNISIESEPQFRMMGVLFFIILIFFCRLLLFNLCVAVVTTTFHRVRKDVASALQGLRVHSSFVPATAAISIGASAADLSSAHNTDDSPLGTAAGQSRARPASPGAVAQLSFRDIIVSIVSHPLFEVVAMSAVAANVVSMSMQQAGVSDERIKLLQFVQLGTEIIFVVELCFRMLGSNSLPEFFSRGHDKFDFFVNMLIAMHLFAQMFGVARARLGMLPSFSALRLVRLVSCVPEINHLLKLSLASITNIVNLLLFTFLFMSVMSLCAMFLFRAHENDGDPAAKDFSSYWVSMNTLFQVLTSDMWRFVLFRAMQYGYETDDVWRTMVPALFLMSFFFAAQAILLNLYIAVIVENFNLASLKKNKEDGARTIRRDIFTSLASTAKRACLFLLPALPKRLRDLVQRPAPPGPPSSSGGRRRGSSLDYRGINGGLDRLPGEWSAHKARSRHGSIIREASFHRMESLKTGLEGNVPALRPPAVEITDSLSLGMFEYHHPLRMLARDVAESSLFKILIMATILCSMLGLALEPPARDDVPPVPYTVLDRVNWASTMVFSVEFLVMVIRDGFLYGKGAYLHSVWNFCDFVVLVLSVLDLAGGNTKEFRVLRLGRALRPLRLIKRNQGMRLMVTAITSTWRPVLMIVCLAVTIATIFALMGMALFKGRFGACTDELVLYPEGRRECAGTVQLHKGVLFPRAWVVPEQNFDTFSRAMVQCLAMNTFKWVDVMRIATAATEEGKAPLEDYSWGHSLFFIIYEIVGSLFVMNLFVAFIIDGFKQLRQAEFKHLQMIAQYEAYMNLVFKASPHRTHPPPSDAARVFVRTQIVQTFAYSAFSQGCMYLNVIFMALYSPATSSERFTTFYLRQNDLFLALLVVEVLINMFAFGHRNVLHNPWQWIDMASIAASCIAFLFPQSGFVRSFRLVKVLRMIKNIPALRMIFMTLVRAIPQFLSVILLLIIISTMFAVLLVNVAGLIREGPLRLGSPVASWPHIRPTFQSYPVAMYTLFQVTQGEDWHLLVYDTSVQQPSCTQRFEDREYGDCGQPLWVMVPIFFGFKLLAEYVLLNLLIGMIIDTFSTTGNHISVQFHFEPVDREHESHNRTRMRQRGALRSGFSRTRRRRNSANPTGKDVRKYLLETTSCVDCWNKVTGGRRHDFILIEDVPLLLKMLPQPLGFARNAFGEPEMTNRDRITCKLMLAELNVIALDRGFDEVASACLGTTAWLSRLLGLKAPIPWKTSEVTFEETFATLICWRCPHLIPPEVKKARLFLLDDIVRTGHAIIISRCIKRWLAAHHDKKVKSGFTSRRSFAETPHASGRASRGRHSYHAAAEQDTPIAVLSAAAREGGSSAAELQAVRVRENRDAAVRPQHTTSAALDAPCTSSTFSASSTPRDDPQTLAPSAEHKALHGGGSWAAAAADKVPKRMPSPSSRIQTSWASDGLGPSSE